MLDTPKRLWPHAEPFAATDRSSDLLLRAGLQELKGRQVPKDLATRWQSRFHLFHQASTLYNIPQAVRTTRSTPVTDLG